MKKRHINPLLGRVLKKIAPAIGAKVILEPEWGIVGQIRFKNGRKRYFRYSSLDLNPLGASEISKDKDYAYFFMRKMGYPTIPGRSFFSDEWCKAIGSRKNIRAAFAYAKKMGFPVIVKPNSGSRGAGVAKVWNKREFYRALKAIFRRDRIALVQKAIKGRDYRVVVLDDKVISAYERIPLNVVGDGTSTIKRLLAQKQAGFAATGRDTKIKSDDLRIAQKLKRQGFSMRSVPGHGECIFLLDNANLSSGGDAIEKTARMHPGFRNIAVRLTRDMGLRLCGVDLIIAGTIEEPPRKYWVIETNAAPGLDHYVLSGKKQKRVVERMYAKVLRAMR